MNDIKLFFTAYTLSIALHRQLDEIAYIILREFLEVYNGTKVSHVRRDKFDGIVSKDACGSIRSDDWPCAAHPFPPLL